MRKLKLDMNALRVESFEVYAGGGRTIGTVRGNVLTPDCDTAYVTEPCFTCNDDDTCGACANTSPRPSCADCSEYGGC